MLSRTNQTIKTQLAFKMSIKGFKRGKTKEKNKEFNMPRKDHPNFRHLCTDCLRTTIVTELHSLRPGKTRAVVNTQLWW